MSDGPMTPAEVEYWIDWCKSDDAKRVNSPRIVHFFGQSLATINHLKALLTETRTKALEEAAECADRELSNGIDDYKSHTGKAIRRLAAEGGEI